MDATLGYAGRRVVVSGAASGIGRATSEALVALGAEVHALDLTDVDVDGLASATRCDVADPEQVDQAVTRIGAVLNGFFGCAGVPLDRDPLEVMLVNFAGLRELARRCAEVMVEGAAIVSMGSVAGYGWRTATELEELVVTESFAAAQQWCESHRDCFEADAYGKSKQAVNLWTRRAAAELLVRGIRITCVNAGPVDTPLFAPFRRAYGEAVLDPFPIGRYADATEIAAGLVWMGSPKASYVTGTSLDIDGGFGAAAGVD